MRTALVGVAGALALALAGAASAQFFNLGAGNTPTAVSNGGAFVAGTNASQYFSWSAGTGLSLIGGVAPGSGVGGQAGISGDGRYISGTFRDAANSNLATMSRYDRTTGAWTALPSLGAASGTETSSGWGMSADGNSVVGLGWISAGGANAIQWNASTGTTTNLGTSVAGRSSRANAVSGDGSVVAGWQDGTTGFRQAAVWTNGVQQVLSGPGGELLSEAGDVSTNGQWVVGGANSGTGNRTWRWSAATGTQFLTSIFDATWSGSATAIADNGTILGFHRPFGPAVFGQGFIWTESTGMVNLTSYVQSQGVVLPSGTVLSLPLAVSADGLTFAGLGRGTTGSFGWVVTIPSPGSLAVLGLAGVMAGRRRR